MTQSEKKNILIDVNISKGITMGKHIEGFPDKDGIDKLIKLAKAMCATVALFSSIIVKKYPDNELINSLLAAIAVVCALIPEIESNFLESTGDNSDVISDPESIPGIDPTAPAAVSPDIT